MLSWLTWVFTSWKLSVTQKSAVTWRIAACTLHIWDASLPLLFLGRSSLLIKSWWIELLSLTSPQYEKWDNCSFFSCLVLNCIWDFFFHLTSFFVLYSTKWQVSLVLTIFLQLHICLLKCCFGLSFQGFATLQTQTETISLEKLFFSLEATQVSGLRYVCQAAFLVKPR